MSKKKKQELKEYQRNYCEAKKATYFLYLYSFNSLYKNDKSIAFQ